MVEALAELESESMSVISQYIKDVCKFFAASSPFVRQGLISAP